MKSDSLAKNFDGFEIDGFRSVRIAGDVSPHYKQVALPVVGKSLEGLNIFDGGTLIYRITNEPQPGKIQVIHTPRGITAKFYEVEPGCKTVTLYGLNKDGQRCNEQRWRIDEISVLGFVVRYEYDFL